MKQLMVAVAIVSLAATGCVNTSQFARKNCGPACHVARSQSAPRPDVVRTVCFDGGLLGKKKNSCDACCGCDTCCECTCGCPEDCCCDTCCECTCGCPEDCCCDTCCECTCGCPEDCCCDAGCDSACGCPEDCCCDAGCGCSDGCCGCDNGGCCSDQGCGPCQRMAGRVASGFCPHSSGYPAMYNFNPGPPSGQTAYPYYTTRGPRDFLQNNPPTIGPY